MHTALELLVVWAAWISGYCARGWVAKWRSREVNVIDGIVMPSPNDERWKSVKCRCGNSGHAFGLGKAYVQLECSSFYGGTFLDGTKLSSNTRYAKAVRRAVIDREATKLLLEG